MLKTLLVLAVLALSLAQKEPPVWPAAFIQRFVEEHIVNGTRHVNTGDTYYDATHNRSRFDKGNGAYDELCNSVLAGNLVCVNLVTNGKRYIYFPQVRKGCYCCDAEHGCGILRRDWLNGAKYEGSAEINGQMFDKWTKPDGSDVDQYYATADSKQVPRRLIEGDTHIVDFIMYTYAEGPIPDHNFDIPSYVIGDCPQTSKCQKFRDRVPQ